MIKKFLGIIVTTIFLLAPSLVGGTTLPLTHHWDGYSPWVSVYSTSSIDNTEYYNSSPSSSLRFTYTSGWCDGFAPDKVYVNFDTGQSEIWFQYWFKYSSNWTPHPVMDKQTYWIMNSKESEFMIVKSGSWIEFRFQSSPYAMAYNRYYNTGNIVTVDPGNWYKVTGHAKINTPGVWDGVFQMWVNDTMVMDHSDMFYRDTGSSGLFNGAEVTPVYGGNMGYCKPEQDEYFWVDFHQIRTDSNFVDSIPTPPGTDSLLPGMTPGNFSIPAGWEVVRTQGFEAGYLGTNEWMNDDFAVISTTQPHEGSRSLRGYYRRDQSTLEWGLGSTPVGEFSDIYLSYWEWTDANARFDTEYMQGYVKKVDASIPYGFHQFIWNYFWPYQAETEDGYFNTTTMRNIIQGEGGGRIFAHYSGDVVVPTGQWVQRELWYHPNTPGQSDGFSRIYLNGQLVHSYENANLNGTVDMDGSSVVAGGVYTKHIWRIGDPYTGTCSNRVGVGLGIDREANWDSCSCPNQCPPDGSVPKFYRNIDDIIVMKYTGVVIGTDTYPPYLYNKYPGPGATGVPLSTTQTSVQVIDNRTDDDGVDQSTISMTVEGVTKTCSTGLTCTGDSSIYTVTYGGLSLSSAQVVDISFTADDLAGNTVNESWSWVATGASTSLTATRVQGASGEGAPGSATFSSTPTDNNLLVAIAGNRSGVSHSDFVISGSGWTKRIGRDTELANNNARRSFAVWTKTAGVSEPTNVQVTALGDVVRLTIVEFDAGVSDETWTFEEMSSNDTGAGSLSPLNTGTTPTFPSGDHIIFVAAMWRNQDAAYPQSIVWSGSMEYQGNYIDLGGNNGITTSYSYYPLALGGAKWGSVSWGPTGSGMEASAGIMVLSISSSGGGGGPTQVAIQTTSLPSGTVGQSYGTQLSASGGSTPYSWQIGNPPSSIPGAPYPSSSLIDGVTWDWGSLISEENGSDLWPLTWLSDNTVMTAWGDGGGFGGTNTQCRTQHGIGIISNDPGSLTYNDLVGCKSDNSGCYESYTHDAGCDADYANTLGGYHDSLLAVGSTIYGQMFFNGTPNYRQLIKSTDSGQTWSTTGPQFEQVTDAFMPMMFVNMGKAYTDNVDGYVYIVMNHYLDYGNVYMVRTPTGQVDNTAAWEYYTSTDPSSPTWGSSSNAEPIWYDPYLESEQGWSFQGDITYFPDLNRFIMSRFGWRIRQMHLYEAPNPWGPWRTISYSQNWVAGENYGLHAHIASKWQTNGGTEFWMSWSGPDYDRWNLIKGTFSLASGSLPPGLSLSSDGSIMGIPTEAGTFGFTVNVSDAGSGTDSLYLSITIASQTPGGQETMYINSIIDTYIDSGFPGSNFNTDPIDPVYQWPDYTVANTVLLRLDQSSIPVDVIIDYAILGFHLVSVEGAGGQDPMKVNSYQITAGYPDITTVTWNTFNGTLLPLGSVDVALNAWNVFFIVTNAIQNCYAADETYCYIALDGGTNGWADTNREFASMDYPTTELRPQLIVGYTPGSGGGGPLPSVHAPGKAHWRQGRGHPKKWK